MWIELTGGPMDGTQLRIPNDWREVSLPLHQDQPLLVDAPIEPNLNLSYVTYGPTHELSPYWRVRHMRLA